MCGSKGCLEVEAERKLQVANVARLGSDLQEGTQVGGIGSNSGPVRVIEGIVSFSAELEAGPLGKGELLEQSEVPVVEARIVQNVAGGVGSHECAGSRGRDEQRTVGSRIH